VYLGAHASVLWRSPKEIYEEKIGQERHVCFDAGEMIEDSEIGGVRWRGGV
jgi:hypothetical protein